MKTKQFKAISKTVGSVRVAMTQEQGKFRVRVRCGNDTLFGQFCDDEPTAKALFDAKVTEFTNVCRPPTAQQLAEWERKAAVLDSLEKKVGVHGCDLAFAVETFCFQAKELGLENVRLITHLYGPRYAVVKPTTVEDVIKDYQPWLAEFGQVSKTHQQNRKGCLRRFAEHFGQRLIHHISMREINDWLIQCKLQNGTWNSYLYSIRDLFRHAKDSMKALPYSRKTEAHQVPSKKVKNVIGPIYSLEQFDRLLNAAPDRDTLLGIILVGKLYVREAEAKKLLGEDFNRENGVPCRLSLPAVVAKARQEEWAPRTITIPEGLRPILAELIPQKGPIFQNAKSVFRRLTTLQQALGGWARNILRRTCCSYGVASGLKKEDVSELAGNSVPVLEKHYLRAAPHDDGIKFHKAVLATSRFANLPAFAKSSLEQLAAEEKRKQQSIRDEANRKSREKTDEDKAAKKAAAVAAKAKAAAEAEEKTGQLNMFPIPSDLGNAA